MTRSPLRRSQNTKLLPTETASLFLDLTETDGSQCDPVVNVVSILPRGDLIAVVNSIVVKSHLPMLLASTTVSTERKGANDVLDHPDVGLIDLPHLQSFL